MDAAELRRVQSDVEVMFALDRARGNFHGHAVNGDGRC